MINDELEHSMSGALEHLFARYVSGNVSAPVSVLLDAHLQMNPVNRQFVSTLEDMAGLALEEDKPVSLRNHDAMLAAILAGQASGVPARDADPLHSYSGLPPALGGYLRMGIDDVPWKKIMPGLWEYEFEDEGQHVSLIRVRAGAKLPVHTHDGQEITLVLQGSFHDGTGNYRSGDIAIADESVNHQPIAGMDEDCICFSVVDNPIRLTGPLGRLINPFIRH